MPRTQRKVPIHPFDQLHGTDTSGLIPGTKLMVGTTARLIELTAYYGVAPSILHGLLNLWLNPAATQVCSPLLAHSTPAIEQTVFLDVGAGKGRALLLASQYPFLRCEGIEINPELASVAQANVERWMNDPASNSLSRVSVSLGDATQHPIPSEPTLAFLFHPFERPVLKRFLVHVERSLTQHRRPFDLLYANAEHGSLLDRHPAFVRLWIGRVPMSPADHVADMEAIAQQKEYGSTGDELCALYRYVGRPVSRSSAKEE